MPIHGILIWLLTIAILGDYGGLGLVRTILHDLSLSTILCIPLIQLQGLIGPVTFLKILWHVLVPMALYIDEVIKTRRLDEGEPPTRYMIKEYSQ